MDSRTDSEFDPDSVPPREIGPLPKPSRPKVILPPTSESKPEIIGSASQPGQPSVQPVARSRAEDSFRDPQSLHTISPNVQPVQIAEESRRPTATKHKQESGGLGGLYFLMASASLMFGIWFIGPRLVEEYHYAAERGKSRAVYENAVDQLEGQPLANVSLAYQMVAQRIRPSVVSVNAIKSVRDGTGLGSGVIMSSEGYILTNAHVLKDASHFLIELHDRRRFEATLIGTDTTSDLALLKIDAPNLIPATWGDSDQVDVGSIVWAIGSPYGFQQTVTSGIISGKDRPGDPEHRKQSLLQTDAAVNPGNSGGPLVDAQGHVIGINTSIFGETFQGISFAVPSAEARFVYQQLIKNGKVTRGYLGVFPTEVDFRDAVRMELPDLDGAKLRIVKQGSPAYNAGIRQGDIIRSWGGVEIKEHKDLYRLAETARPDTRVEVTLLRNGQEHSTQVVIGTLPEADVVRSSDSVQQAIDKSRSFSLEPVLGK